MLVTLGLLQGAEVSPAMVLAFVAGVSLVFVGFGGAILSINRHLLTSTANVRRAFAVAGGISLLVGTQMFF